MKKVWVDVLFWGSCWGLMEASLGYVIHVLAVPFPGLPGFLLFPCAFILMNKAMESTGKKDIIIQMSLVAAGLKLLDFLILGNDPIRIINPAISMVMEASAVTAVFMFSKQVNWGSSFMMGMVWRGSFLIYMVLLSYFELPAGLVTSGLAVALGFLVMESAINALLIAAYLQSNQRQIRVHPKWQLASALGVIAVVLQWVI